MAEHDAPGLARTGGPSLVQLAKTWVAVGSQSLGGGASTLYLMRTLLVERYKWIEASAFGECWALVQVSPGMRLVAFTGLLGERIAGVRGVAISVAAMMLPSAVITVLFTAGLVEVEQHPLVQSVLRGVVPATGGMTLAMGVFFAQSSLRKGRLAVVDWTVVWVSALAIALAGLPVLLILFAGGALGVFALRSSPPPAPKTAQDSLDEPS